MTNARPLVRSWRAYSAKRVDDHHQRAYSRRAGRGTPAAKRPVVRIAFFVRPVARDGRIAPQVSATTEATIALLRERGVRVDVVVPEAELWDLGALKPEHDLYVLKSKTPLSLSLAGALEVAGARTVNRVAASGLAKDKVLHSALLARAGVPVPRAWTCAGGPALRSLLTGIGPNT